MSRRDTRTKITADHFSREVETAARTINTQIGSYDKKVMVISALEAGIHFCWSKGDTATKLTNYDRFPKVDGFTPDFFFQWSNGYSLVGEYKRHWRSAPECEKDLKQLAAYRKLVPELSSTEFADNLADEANPSRENDVLLLLGSGTDELACESISDSPLLGPGSVVISDVTIEPSNESVRFNYRKFDGKNGKFSEPNAGPVGTDLDLNKWFVESRGFWQKCDSEAFAAVGECPFVNDDPPTAYTVAVVILSHLNETLEEGDRDEIATSNEVSVTFTMSKLNTWAEKAFPRVPSTKLKKWTNDAVGELVVIGLLESSEVAGVHQFKIRLDENLDRFARPTLVKKMAKGRMTRKFSIIRDPGPNAAQPELEFEP